MRRETNFIAVKSGIKLDRLRDKRRVEKGNRQNEKIESCVSVM